MTLGMFSFNGARRIGISDDQERNELAAQRRFFAAEAEMRAAIDQVNASSVLVEIEPSAFTDFLNDECPTREYWNGKLADARYG